MPKSHAEYWREEIAERAFIRRQHEISSKQKWSEVSELIRNEWIEKARIIMLALDDLE